MMDVQELIKSEGNEMSYQYRGYDCLIKRVNHEYMGHLAGYIRIPSDHYLHGMSHEEIEEKFDYEIPAHGGLTYSGSINQKGHWIGFDCAHYGDLLPNSPSMFEIPGCTYKDMNYVKGSIVETIDFIEDKVE